jgi:predicted RNA-binding Zn ribbon-like protein
MDDLDLVVELINTVWVLADPPDRLTHIGHYKNILVSAGQDRLAAGLTPADLAPLRALRERLRAVFHAPDEQHAAALVNALLNDARAIPQLTATPTGGVNFTWDAGRRGCNALRARLPGALATHIAKHGTRRLGICAAPPCDCVFVDRTRPGTRKYCCDKCNDRAAASNYYYRHRQPAGEDQGPHGDARARRRRA